MEDDEVFEEKMKRLTKELARQFKESKKLEKKIKESSKSACAPGTRRQKRGI